jgi:hypothetical protein
MEPLVQIGGTPRPRLPEWARKSRTHFESLNHLKRGLRGRKLHTVCEEARCPNMGECWAAGTATLMILGDVCTRNCAYCAVAHGRPAAVDTADLILAEVNPNMPRTLGDSFLAVDRIARLVPVDDPAALKPILDALAEIAGDTPVVFPVHPRTRKVITEMSFRPESHVRLIDPVGYLDMVALLGLKRYAQRLRSGQFRIAQIADHTEVGHDRGQPFVDALRAL